MTLEYRKLNPTELEAEVARIPAWKVRDDLLCRDFEFHNYMEGALFALKVAHVAEDMNHHPEITICYRKVEVVVNTHAVSGISSYDLELARRIDAIATT